MSQGALLGQNEMDEALRAEAVAASDLGTWHWDLVTDTWHWSEQCLEMFGLADPSMTYQRFLAALHPEDRSRIDLAVRQALADGSHYDVEMRALHPNGAVRWIRSKGRATLDRAGKPRALQGIAIGIDAQKQAEEISIGVVKRLDVALEAGGLGMWELNLDLMSTRWDGRLAAMLGLPPEPVVLDAERRAAFFHPEDRARSDGHLLNAIATGTPFVEEFRARTVNGEVRWFVSHGMGLPSTSGPRRAVGVVRDITEQRRREEALRQALLDREMLMREADHRIKNSLQLVVSVLNLQRSRVTEPEAAEALANAAVRVGAVAKVHETLHDSANLRRIDVASMLRKLVAQLIELNPRIDLRLTARNLPEIVTDRAIPLGLIVSELITNAMRHAYPNGVGMVDVEARHLGGCLVIDVADRGIGMPLGPQREGLGTSLVRGLAGMIGAAIATERPPEGGTRISLKMTLPCV